MTEYGAGNLLNNMQLGPVTKHCSLLPGWSLSSLDPPLFTVMPGEEILRYMPSFKDNFKNVTAQMFGGIAMLPETACDMSPTKPTKKQSQVWRNHYDSYKFRIENCQINPNMSLAEVPYKSARRYEPNFVAVDTASKDALLGSDLGLGYFKKERKKLAMMGMIHEVKDVCPYWRDICGSDSPPHLPTQYKNCTLPSGYRWLKATDPRHRTTEWFAAPNGGALCRARTQLEAGALIDLFSKIRASGTELEHPAAGMPTTDSLTNGTPAPGIVPGSDDDLHNYVKPRNFCGVDTAWDPSHLEAPPCKEPQGYVYKRVGFKRPKWQAFSEQQENIHERIPKECTQESAEPIDPHRKAELESNAISHYERVRSKRYRSSIRRARKHYHSNVKHKTTSAPPLSRRRKNQQRLKDASAWLFSLLKEDTPGEQTPHH